MKKLSIIIPYHGEPRESVSPLLLSLNSQKNINFNDIEILINNDSTNDNISDVLELCDNLKDVSIITCYNGGGPGPSRQHCLDNSQGDYILFFDADDTLLTNTTLSKILNIITSGMDVYNFKVAWEKIENNELGYQLWGRNLVGVWGKAYRRKFIYENGIQFLPELKHYGEDQYFNLTLNACFPKEISVDLVTYVYTVNNSQFCKPGMSKISDNKNSSPHDIVMPLQRAYEFISKRIDIELCRRDISLFIYLLYDDYFNKNFTEETKEIIKQDMRKFINDFDPMLKCINLMTFENNNPISFEKFVKSLVNNY